jgi:hypothetical protein
MICNKRKTISKTLIIKMTSKSFDEISKPFFVVGRNPNTQRRGLPFHTRTHTHMKEKQNE